MVIKISESVGDLLAASQIYQFISTCLLEPNKEALEMLRSEDYMSEVKSCIEISGSSEMLLTFELLRRGLEGVDVDGLERSYRATFGAATERIRRMGLKWKRTLPQPGGTMWRLN